MNQARSYDAAGFFIGTTALSHRGGHPLEVSSPLKVDVKVSGDLKTVGKSLDKLIDVVSRGMGKAAQPVLTVVNAYAEGRASLIKSTTDAELERRALERQRAQEIRRQRNLEAIVEKAAEHMPPQAAMDPVDPDWSTRFFVDAQDISNEHLQHLWAKLLVTEVARPGRISRRTLSTVRDLSPSDAQLFSRLASVTWRIADGSGFVIRLAEPASLAGATGELAFDSHGLTYGDFLELKSLNLVMDLEGLGLEITPPSNSAPEHAGWGQLHLCGSTFQIDRPMHHEAFMPIIPLTSVGCDLLSVCDVKPPDGYVKHCTEFLSVKGLRLCPVPS